MKSASELAEYTECTEEEMSHLRSADPVMASLVDGMGPLKFEMDPDLHTSLVRCIVGQQISIPMYERIWDRFREAYGEVPEPGRIIDGGLEGLRSLGIPRSRSEYILGISRGVLDGTIDLCQKPVSRRKKKKKVSSI